MVEQKRQKETHRNGGCGMWQSRPRNIQFKPTHQAMQGKGQKKSKKRAKKNPRKNNTMNQNQNDVNCMSSSKILKYPKLTSKWTGKWIKV